MPAGLRAAAGGCRRPGGAIPGKSAPAPRPPDNSIRGIMHCRKTGARFGLRPNATNATDAPPSSAVLSCIAGMYREHAPPESFSIL